MLPTVCKAGTLTIIDATFLVPALTALGLSSPWALDALELVLAALVLIQRAMVLVLAVMVTGRLVTAVTLSLLPLERPFQTLWAVPL